MFAGRSLRAQSSASSCSGAEARVAGSMSSSGRTGITVGTAKGPASAPAVSRAPSVLVRFSPAQEMEFVGAFTHRLRDRMSDQDRARTFEFIIRIETVQICEGPARVHEAIINAGHLPADLECVE